MRNDDYGNFLIILKANYATGPAESANLIKSPYFKELKTFYTHTHTHVHPIDWING